MEEVDDILIATLRQLGVLVGDSVKSVKQFTPDIIVHAVVSCLRVVNPNTAFPTVMPPEMSARFRICANLADTLTGLGYQGELGFHQFLYPNEEDSRKMLRWLVERLSKGGGEDEEEEELGANALVNRSILSALEEARKQLWVPPFASPQTRRSTHLLATYPLDIAVPPRKRDNRTEDLLNYYRRHLPYVTQQPPQRTALAASILEHNFGLCLRDHGREGEFSSLEGEGTEAARARRAEIGRVVSEALRGAMVAKTTGSGLSSTADSFAQLVDEHLDTGRKEGGTVLSRRIGFAQEEADVLGQVVVGGQDDETLKKSAEEIQREREEALEALQSQLQELAAQIRSVERESEMTVSSIRQVEERIHTAEHNTPQLEEEYKVLKRTMDLLPNYEDNLRELKKIAGTSAQRLVELSKQWEEHRIPLIEAVRQKEDCFGKRKTEAKAKLDKVKDMREDMKGMIRQIQGREERYNVLLDEWKRLPKNVNRAMYLRRILDIVKNLRKQKIDIDKVLEDTRDVKKEINAVNEALQRSFAATDELVFRDAKRDTNSKQAYKLLVQMHETFQELVRSVEENGSIQNQIRDLDTKIEQLVARDTQTNLDRVLSDLKQVKHENKALATSL